MMERLHFGSNASYSALEASIHVARYALAKSVCSGKAVLDAACGEGYGSFLMAGWGAESVVGIDLSEEAVALARRKFPAPGVSYLAGDVLRLDELVRGRTFDVIVSLETIEHVTDAELFLHKLRGVASPGATIIISCPNDHWYYSGDEGNPFHRRKYTFEEYKELAESVLGRATSWRIGSLALGFGSVRHDAPLAAAQSEGQSALRGTRPVGTALLVPAEQATQPTTGNCSFFVGVWGPDTDDVSTVTYPVSMDAGHRALLGEVPAAGLQEYVNLLEARRNELERTLAEAQEYVSHLEARRDEMERAQLGQREDFKCLEARRDEMERAQLEQRDYIARLEARRDEMEGAQLEQRDYIARLEARRDELEALVKARPGNGSVD